MADSDERRAAAAATKPLPLPFFLFISLAGIGLTFVVVICVASLIFFFPWAPEFRVESTSFEIGTGNSPPIAATVALTVWNPNKRLAVVAYGGLEVHADSLFGTMLPPFTLEAKSETTLLANFSVSGVNGGAAARFGLRMQCGVRLDARRWWWLANTEMQLKVHCGELVVSIPTNGTSPRVCGVDAVLGRYYN